MVESEIIKRLDEMPDISGAINAFFYTANNKNSQNYRLAINNSCKFEGIDFIYPDRITDAMTQSFSEYYDKLKKYDYGDYLVNIRMEMIIYGLFWENAAVLRLLASLVEIAESGDYIKPCLLITDHKTAKSIKNFIKKSKHLSFDIAHVVEAIYYHQIRNAAFHSQLLFDERGIFLMNHKSNRPDLFPWISFTTWELLYSKTCEFIDVLFSKRYEEFKRLAFSQQPK